MIKIKSFKFNYAYVMLSFLALVVIVFTIFKQETLWNGPVWMSMARQLPEYGVFVLGAMFCFISGNIDISFVALANFASIIAVMYMKWATQGNVTVMQTGGIILTAVLIAIVIGAIGGFINGNLVSGLGIPAIMATLATLMVFRGLSIALTRGDAVTGIPLLYSEIGHLKILGVFPVSLLIFIIILLISTFLLKYTTYGKKLYMMGSNPKAAKFSAINVTRMTNITFVISGVFAAIAGMLMVSTMNSAKADYGSSYLMRSILILVLAGVLPDGGIGKIRNVLIAIVSIQIISSGVNMFPNLNTYYSSLISALMLLIVLMATTSLLKERKLKKENKKNSNRETPTDITY